MIVTISLSFLMVNATTMCIITSIRQRGMFLITKRSIPPLDVSSAMSFGGTPRIRDFL